MDQQRVAVKSKQSKIMETFRGTSKKVSGDGIWKERGVATLWYDNEGKLLNIEVANNNDSGSNLEELFGSMCDSNALYSLKMPDFDLLTT